MTTFGEKSLSSLRRSALAVALLIVPVASLVAPAPAHAAAQLFGCSARQEGGDATTRCFYIAGSTRGFVRVNEVEGYIIGYAGYDHSPGASQHHSGTAYFAQIPGDLCHVTMFVASSSATGDVVGGSLI
jgi:hypothetical protein